MKLTLLFAYLFFLCSPQWATAQTKLAFVAGVERYEKSGLTNLEFAEDDARQVQAELKKLGFKVRPVIGDEASLKNLNSAIDGFIASTKQLNKSDIVIVYFSGHGVQKLTERKNAEGGTIEVEEPFFCPKDALKNDVKTLLSLNAILKRLEESSGCDHNFILLDACRDSADKSGKGGIDGSTIRELSDKLALFFAAKSGQRSFESTRLQHGIFTHYLLEGLRGKAADADNEITFQGLASYVAKQVERNSPELLEVAVADAQRPNLMGNLSGTIVLGKVNRPVQQNAPLIGGMGREKPAPAPNEPQSTNLPSIASPAKPQIATQVNVTAKTGPGFDGKSLLEIELLELTVGAGKPLANREIVITVRVKGSEPEPIQSVKTDKYGRVSVYSPSVRDYPPGLKCVCAFLGDKDHMPSSKEVTLSK